MKLRDPQHRFLDHVRRHGPTSRRDLQRATGVRPNTVGDLVAELIHAGLLTELDPVADGRGRPSRPVAIDPQRRHVLGLALLPGRVSAARLSLTGHAVGPLIDHPTTGVGSLVDTAQAVLAEALADRPGDVLSVGVTSPGLIDAASSQLLTRAADDLDHPIDLAPILRDAGDRPVVLENDAHALAAQYVLTHQPPPDEDTLLVTLRDGAIGAALLINGRPNRGCVVGANELGQTRLPLAGQSPTLESIFSTAWLASRDGRRTDLMQRLADGPASDGLTQLVRLTALGLANAVNLIRPNRVVLAGAIAHDPARAAPLLDAMRPMLLTPLRDRVLLTRWSLEQAEPAHAAAWLALAPWFLPAWRPVVTG